KKPTRASFFILYNDGTIYRHLRGEFIDFDSLLEDVSKVGSEHILYGYKNYGCWGRYTICGDSIKSQTYFQFGWGYVSAISDANYIISNGMVQSIVKEGIGPKYI